MDSLRNYGNEWQYIFNYLLYCNLWNSREYITTVRKSSAAQLYKALSLSACIKEMSVPQLPRTRAAGSVGVSCKPGREKSSGRTMALLKPLRTEVCPYSSMLLHCVRLFSLLRNTGALRLTVSIISFSKAETIDSWLNEERYRSLAFTGVSAA